jgi:hypothetical protein
VAVRPWWTERLWAGITPSGTWGWGLVCCHVSASKSTPGSGDGLTGPPWRPDGELAWHYGHGQSLFHTQTCSKLMRTEGSWTTALRYLRQPAKCFIFCCLAAVAYWNSLSGCVHRQNGIFWKVVQMRDYHGIDCYRNTYTSEALNIHRSFIRYGFNFSFVYRLTTKIKHRACDSCGNILDSCSGGDNFESLPGRPYIV